MVDSLKGRACTETPPGRSSSSSSSSLATCSRAQRLLSRIAVRTVTSLLLLSPAQYAFADPATPALGQCITESNPQTTVQVCRQLGLVDGNQRVRGCQANENCFSTAAIAGGKRVSPWFYRQTGDEAREVLTEALRLEGLKVLQSKPVDGSGGSVGGFYLLAAEKAVPKQPPGSSVFYEFLLKSGPPSVVLYRTVIDKTVFVYPLQQPVGDFGYLKNKLESIRSRTGFRVEEAAEIFDSPAFQDNGIN